MKRKNVPLLYVRQDLGSGRPLVLLHGMFADGTQWRVMADLLAKYYRVIVIDLLGHGKSPRPPKARYSPDEHSKALRATLEKIDATENVTVVGYSMGGTVALQYAADYHDVIQLYLISTPFYLDPEQMVDVGYANSLMYTKMSVGLYKHVDKLLRPGKILHKLAKNDDLMKWLHYLIDAYDNKLDPEIMRRNLDQLINHYPFVTNLAKVTAPITFYAGKRDVFVVQSQLRALKKIQPLMEIQSVGIVKNDHMLVQYLPQKMVSILTQYHKQTLYISTDKGQGEVIVLLHGIESASSYWRHIVPDLAKMYRVITIDLLGFGKSPKPQNIAYTLEEHAIWLERTLSQKGINNFHLIGHSLGSLVALRYAQKYKSKVKTLTLVSPVFFDPNNAKKFLVHKLQFARHFSDTSYLTSTVARAIGSERIRPYVPTIRSIENAVSNQAQIYVHMNDLTGVKVRVIYGSNDPLVDKELIGKTVESMPNTDGVMLDHEGHNFALYRPKKLINNLPFAVPEKLVTKKVSVLPKGILRQLFKLAFPILLLKGLLFSSVGILLLSQYRQETLVVSVALVAVYQSIQFVKGSFSLKNEGLSYIGYMSIGIVGIIFGYILYRDFNLSLKIAVFICSGLIFINGLSRLIAGYAWTTDRRVRRRQLFSGWILLITGITALLGSMVSAHLIVLAISVYAIVKGGFFIAYAIFTAALAYARSY